MICSKFGVSIFLKHEFLTLKYIFRMNPISRITSAMFIVLIMTMTITSCSNQKDKVSASMKRFQESGLKFENDSEFYTYFKVEEISGIGLEEGVTRRDPTGVIKVGETYYVWYTRPPAGVPVVGPEKANDTLRAYPWDLAEIWCATSPDGNNWTEQGLAVACGPEGSFDARTVFTPDVLVADGRYYLYYQAAGSLAQGKGGGDFIHNVIAMSWADSPDGPWTRFTEPILETGPDRSIDHLCVHDPTFIVREGKYFMYYKGHAGGGPENSYGKWGRSKKWGIPISWCVAISDKPEGPFVKSELNPVIVGGHEVAVFPYRQGVCALVNQGPERNTVQFAEDGLNFYPVAHGVNIPHASGVYRVGNFTDTDVQPGQGITWGVCLDMGYVDGVRWDYIARFDCDLSLEKGDRIKKKNEQLQAWLDEE